MNRLKEARKAKKMTQAQVADYLSVSQATYSYWELERNKMDGDTLSKLSALFNVSTDYLLGLTDKKDPSSPEGAERATSAADASDETKLALELLNRLTPENRAKAMDHLDYLLARQEGSEDKK